MTYAGVPACKVSKLSFYFKEGSEKTAGKKQQVKGLIYSDEGGKPGNLLGETEVIEPTAPITAGFVDLNFATPIFIPAGTYWIGIMTGTTVSVVGYVFDAVAGARQFATRVFASGPFAKGSETAWTTDTQQISCFATFTEVPVMTKPGTQKSSKKAPTKTWLTLAGTNSPTEFKATGLPTGLSLNSGTGAITGEPTAAVGSYTVEIWAKNAEGEGAKVSFTWEISEEVTIGAIGNQSSPQSSAITPVKPTGTGATLTWKASGAKPLPAGLSISSSTGEITGTPTTVEAKHLVGIEVESADGGSALKTFEWTITASGAVPVISKPAKQESNKSSALPSALVVSATNSPTGWEATVGNPLPAGLSINASGEITGTPTAAVGTYTVGLIAKNGTGNSAEVTFEWKINAKLALKKPLEQNNEEGKALTPFQLGEVTAATGVSPYTYAIESGFPPGITVKANGVVEGTPTTAGTFASCKLKVTDGQGIVDKQTFTWVITASSPAPTITNPGELHSIVNVPTSINLTTTGTITSFSASGLPLGMNINTSTGEISGTPTSVQLYVPTVKAVGPGGTAEQTFSWFIIEGPKPALLNVELSSIGVAS